LIERKTLADAAFEEIQNSGLNFSVTADKYKLSYENVLV
jgi:hypothetical protein